MRTCPFALAAVLALAMALPSRAAEKPHPAQDNQTHPKKVWTNDGLDQLHWRGLISIVGQEPAESVAAQSAPAPSTPAFPVYNSRLEDPSWYAEKAAALQAELDKRAAALQEQQTALAQATNGITQAGIALDQPGIGVTPEAGIAVLQAQVQDVQNQIDALSDLARQNSIPPGVLRG
jgi:hypothetical protein